MVNNYRIYATHRVEMLRNILNQVDNDPRSSDAAVDVVHTSEALVAEIELQLPFLHFDTRRLQ